jgi:predicted enzyme related to lactoylglutathione lyase
MGRPVVHFEVMGKDGEKLRSFYAELFDWAIDADNPLGYGIIKREMNFEGVGIGGGIGGVPEPLSGHLTFYVEVPDVETALARAEELGGTRLMGPLRSTARSRARPVQRPGRTHGRTGKGPGVVSVGNSASFAALDRHRSGIDESDWR